MAGPKTKDDRHSFIRQRTVFVRTLLLGLGTSLVPLVLFAFLAIRVSSTSIADQVAIARHDQLTANAQTIASRIRGVELTILQVSSGPDTMMLAHADGLTTSARLAARQLIDRMIDIANRDDLIESVYAIGLPRGHVLSEALYSDARFPDREVYNYLSRASDIAILPSRELAGSQTTTLIRRFYVIGGTRQVYVIANMDSEALYAPLSTAPTTKGGAYVIHDRDGTALFQAGSRRTNETWTRSTSEESDDDTRNIRITVPLGELDLSVSFIQPRSELFISATRSTQTMLLIVASLATAATAATYWLSNLLYRPLFRVAEMARAQLDEPVDTSADDYAVLRHLLDDISESLPVLRSRSARALSYERRYALHEKLALEEFDPDEFRAFADEIGIAIDSRLYYVTLIAIERGSGLTALEVAAHSTLSDCAVDEETIVCRESDSRLLLFSATTTAYKPYLTILERLHANALAGGISTTAIVSTPFYFVEDLPDHYARVSQAMESRFFLGTERVVTAFTSRQPALRPNDVSSLTEQVTTSVRSLRANRARTALHSLILLMKSREEPIRYVRYELGRLAYEVLTALRSVDAADASGDVTPFDLYRRIDSASAIDEIEKVLLELIAIVDPVPNGSGDGEQQAGVVHRIVRFLESNYDRDLSLDDIAKDALLSTGHMCNVFKRATGRTVLETLTEIRLERARELLGRPGLKVSEIARLVGYRNSQSLVRFFRRRHGVSPSQYRTQIRNDGA